MSVVTIAGAILGTWAMLSIVGAERDRELTNWRKRQAEEAAAQPPPEPPPPPVTAPIPKKPTLAKLPPPKLPPAKAPPVNAPPVVKKK